MRRAASSDGQLRAHASQPLAACLVERPSWVAEGHCSPVLPSAVVCLYVGCVHPISPLRGGSGHAQLYSFRTPVSRRMNICPKYTIDTCGTPSFHALGHFTSEHRLQIKPPSCFSSPTGVLSRTSCAAAHRALVAVFPILPAPPRRAPCNRNCVVAGVRGEGRPKAVIAA